MWEVGRMFLRNTLWSVVRQTVQIFAVLYAHYKEVRQTSWSLGWDLRIRETDLDSPDFTCSILIDITADAG